MPKVGLTMTEGSIVQWHKRAGEYVQKGELIFTFETEKSTLEFESPFEGVLESILVPVGQVTHCFVPVAVISPISNLSRPISPRARLRSRERGIDLNAVSGSGPDGVVLERDVLAYQPKPATARATPVAERMAAEMGIDLATTSGTGRDGMITREDVEARAVGTIPRGDPEAGAVGAIPRGSPDTGAVGTIPRGSPDASMEGAIPRGSPEAGAVGAIPRGSPDASMEGAIPRGSPDTGMEGAIPGGSPDTGAVGAIPGSSPDTGAVGAIPRGSPDAGIDLQTLTMVRRITAQRIAESARTAPHVTVTTEADATALVSAREQLNAELNEKVSYNALLVAIVARALREHPQLNAYWADGSVGLYQAINVGVAVDTPRGLYVPVVRDATRPLIQLHRDLAGLLARMLADTISGDDFANGTFTITNLGMYEIDFFTPIINQPQAAILGIGRILGKPVARGEQVVVRQMMTLSLSFDHRIVDGAPAAKFLQRVKALIERPFALMV